MNEGVHLRYAKPDEVPMLEALQLQSSLEWASDHADLLAHPDAIELPVQSVLEQQVRVVEIDSVVIGFSVTIPTGDGAAELDGLFVLPAHMGSGFGRALVDDAADIARGQGLQQLNVIANPNALGFYTRLGFVVTGEAQTRFKPAPRMCLYL
jgi:GNAT superfamily N-acetyltransferase